MGKAKNTGKPAKSSHAKKGKASKPRERPVDPAVIIGKSGAVLASVRTGLPELTPELVHYFDTRHSEAECLALGGSTVSGDVLALTLRWLPEIAKRLKRTPAIRGYGPMRLMYLTQCTDALIVKMKTQVGSNTSKSSAIADLDHDHTAAEAIYESLRGTLSAVVGRDPKDLAALNAALQPAVDDDVLASNLRGLAKLAERFLSDGSVRETVARDAGIDEALIASARAAATSVSRVAARVTALGKRVGKDSPEVNTAEGRVLFELRVVREKIAETKAADGTVMQLPNPGKLLRVFVAHPHRAAEAVPGAAPGPATSATPKDATAK